MDKTGDKKEIEAALSSHKVRKTEKDESPDKRPITGLSISYSTGKVTIAR